MQVKVWNDNIYPLSQFFKGNKVLIPAKSFIEMEFYEAHEFLGTYHPIDYDADGKQDPKTYKMLRVDRQDAVRGIQAKIKNLCSVCKHESPSKEELEAHVKARHSDHVKLELPEVDESILATASSAPVDMEALKAKIREELRAEILSESKTETKTPKDKKKTA